MYVPSINYDRSKLLLPFTLKTAVYKCITRQSNLVIKVSVAYACIHVWRYLKKLAWAIDKHIGLLKI